MPVWGIVVTPAGGGAAADDRASAARGQPLCRIWFEPGKTASDPALARWIYGTAPIGFTTGRASRSCRERLTRSMSARARVVGHFAIEADGSVRMIDGQYKS